MAVPSIQFTRGIKLSIFIGICVLIFLLGLFSRTENALGANQCKMTYTSLDHKLIPVKSDIQGPLLYKYSNALNKKLNKQPVLFIPGHQGSFDQVRSLSSSMHNDDEFFQYFTLDFHAADTAYHGGTAITQAIFVNDALKTIQDLYANKTSNTKQQQQPQPRIMVVGHSLGGIVARTAVLLDNHPVTTSAGDSSGSGSSSGAKQSKSSDNVDDEFSTSKDDQPQSDTPSVKDDLTATGSKEPSSSSSLMYLPCAVSDIILLSSPNHRSPYAPDASMDTLFNAVNKAWLASAYPHSKACTIATYKRTTQDSIASGNGVNGSNTMIPADWTCSYCAGKIRLISITGGSLDNLVHSTITRLDGLAPIPRNLTRERLTPVNTNSNTKFLSTFAAPLVKYLSPVHVLTSVVKAVYSMSGMGKNGNVTISSNTTVVTVEEKVEEEKGKEVKGKEETDVQVELSSSSCAANGTCTNPTQISSETDVQKENTKVESSTAISPSQAFVTTTKKQWYQDMAQYQEPHHISLLTTQLTDVGFPVDHKAILWCYQLVSSVTKAMKLLSTYDDDHTIGGNDNGDSSSSSSSTGTVNVANDHDNDKVFRARDFFALSSYDTLEGSYLHNLFHTTSSESDKKKKHGDHRDASGSGNTGVGSESPILPVAQLLERNMSRTNWMLAAGYDREYVYRRLRRIGGTNPLPSILVPIQALAVEFIHQHVIKVWICYVMIAILCMTVPLIRSLSNNKGLHSQANEWHLLHPWVHFHGQIVIPAFEHMLYRLLPRGHWLLHNTVFDTPFATMAGGLLLLFIPKVLFDYFARPAYFFQSYAWMFHWLLAYGLALCNRAIGLVLITMTRWIGKAVMTGCVWIGRWTIWTKANRKAWRHALRGWKKRALEPNGDNAKMWLLLVNDSLFSGLLVLTLITLSMMIAVGISVFPRYQQGSITLSTLLMSGASLIVSVFALLAWLTAWFFPGVDNSKGAMEIAEEEGEGGGEDSTSTTSNKTYDHQTQLLLMFLAMPVLIYPNALFSWTMLFGSLESFQAALPHFNMFGPERLNWFLFLSALSFHWWISRIHSLYPIYYRLMEPITWLTELLGPDEDDDNNQSNHHQNHTSVSYNSNGNGQRSRGGGGHSKCIHEDGGRYAVFESTEGDPSISLQKLSPNVVLGASYRVIACACYKDKKLKDRSEWCEFCLCRWCGGKDLPKEFQQDRSKRKGSGNGDGPINDFSPDLMLLGALFGCTVGTFIYAGEHYLYKHLYLMGMVASAYITRDFSLAMMKFLQAFCNP